MKFKVYTKYTGNFAFNFCNAIEFRCFYSYGNLCVQAEDAVCLADYCDIMRCTVWEHGIKGSSTSNTDVELWGRDPAAAAGALVVSKTALQPVKSQKGE